jgi:signal transduction histidine kinase/CheY-like chemotaxis protein/HPt (histidine-containing phosphotransfer) domain-containing protein
LNGATTRTTLHRSATTWVERVVAAAAAGQAPRSWIERHLDRRLAGAAGEARLRRTFHLSRLLDATAVVPAEDLRDDGERLTLVSRDLGGTTLDGLLAAGPLPVATALAIGRDIATALAHVHAAGFVHGDVHAGHVIVPPGRHAGVRLIGLGSTRPAGSATAPAGGIDDGGIDDGHGATTTVADPRDDVRALGALLLQMLTGERPRAGRGIAAALAAAWRGDGDAGKRPAARRPPGRLLGLLQRLLDDAPGRRQPDAAGTGAALAALLHGHRRGPRRPRRDAEDTLASWPLPHTRLHGRDGTMNQLLALAARAREGASRQVAWVHGPPGAGKRRLLGELARALAAAGTRVAAVRADAGMRDEFDVLHAALAQWHGGRVPTDAATPRADAAVRAVALPADRPLLLVVEAADHPDAGVFARLLDVLPTGVPLLVVASSDRPPATAAEHAAVLELPGLPADAFTPLVADALALPPEAITWLADALHAACGGQPGTALELLRRACECGALLRRDNTVEADRARLQQVLAAHRAAATPVTAALRATAVQALACVGSAPVTRLASMLARPPAAVLRGLAPALASGAVQASFAGDAPTYAFIDAAARGSAWARLRAATRAAWHRRAALVLAGEAFAPAVERQSPDDGATARRVSAAAAATGAAAGSPRGPAQNVPRAAPAAAGAAVAIAARAIGHFAASGDDVLLHACMHHLNEAFDVPALAAAPGAQAAGGGPAARVAQAAAAARSASTCGRLSRADRIALAGANRIAAAQAAAQGRWHLAYRWYRHGLAALPADCLDLRASLCAGAAGAACSSGDETQARRTLAQAPDPGALVVAGLDAAAADLAAWLELMAAPGAALRSALRALALPAARIRAGVPAPPRAPRDTMPATDESTATASVDATTGAGAGGPGSPRSRLLAELLLQALRAAPAHVVPLAHALLGETAPGSPFVALARAALAAAAFAHGAGRAARRWLRGIDCASHAAGIPGLMAGLVYHALARPWLAPRAVAWLADAVARARALARPDLAALAAAHAVAGACWQESPLSRFLPLAAHVTSLLPPGSTAAHATIDVYRSAVAALRAGRRWRPPRHPLPAPAREHAIALAALSARVHGDAPATPRPGNAIEPVRATTARLTRLSPRTQREHEPAAALAVATRAPRHARSGAPPAARRAWRAHRVRCAAWLDVAAGSLQGADGSGAGQPQPARRLLEVGRRLAAAADATTAAERIAAEARALFDADWCCVLARLPAPATLAHAARSRHLLPALPPLAAAAPLPPGPGPRSGGSVLRLALGEADTLLFATPHDLDAGAVLAACLFAEQAGIALANARLFAATARSRDAFRLLFDTAREGLAEATEDGTLLRANAALAGLLAHPDGETLVRERRGIVDLFGDPAAAASLREAALAHGVAEAEVTLAARGGAPVPASVQLRAARGSDGVQRLHASFADLLERERRQAAERERARADAQAAARSAFLAHMSHEIRTPLNAIVGYTRLARSAPAERRGEHLATIDRAAQQLLRLVNDVLDLSRIDAGQLELESAPFAPGDVLREVALLHAQAAAEKATRLDVDDRIRLPAGRWLAGDRHRIAQVLTNLVANAVRFTDAGRVTLAALPRAVTATHCSFELVVSDTGIGMDAATLSRVFEPYVQAAPGTARQFGGSGLGLAIVERLVRRMGGEVDVESQPGAGSRFRLALTLPLTERAPGGAVDATRVDLAGAAVLLVDDDAVNRALGAELLERGGGRVTVAASGEEALQRAATHAYAAVLLDLRMPGLDGYATCRALRALPGLRTTPIIALTADATTEARTAAAAAGFTDYLTKPLEPAQLLRTLARHAIGTVSERPRRRRGDARPGPGAPAGGERLPGIDVATALARHRGDAAFLARMLGAFLAHYRDAPQRLQALLDGGRRDDAARLAHSLAGVAGSFGAHHYGERCREVERALDAGDPQPAALLAAFARAHVEFVGSAQALASEHVRLRDSDRPAAPGDAA